MNGLEGPVLFTAGLSKSAVRQLQLIQNAVRKVTKNKMSHLLTPSGLGPQSIKYFTTCPPRPD